MLYYSAHIFSISRLKLYFRRIRVCKLCTEEEDDDIDVELPTVTVVNRGKVFWVRCVMLFQVWFWRVWLPCNSFCNGIFEVALLHVQVKCSILLSPLFMYNLRPDTLSIFSTVTAMDMINGRKVIVSLSKLIDLASATCCNDDVRCKVCSVTPRLMGSCVHLSIMCTNGCIRHWSSLMNSLFVGFMPTTYSISAKSLLFVLCLDFTSLVKRHFTGI